MERVWLIVCVVLIASAGARESHAGDDPLKDLQAGVDKVIALLKDPDFDKNSKEEEQREKIMVVVKDLFDFVEVSKRSLGASWSSFTPPQRKEFADVFADFLGVTYFKKVKAAYQGETVVYLSQEVTEKTRAVIKTAIPRSAGDIPITYRMLKKNGQWRVYDVIIEGISLVKNYRVQFSKLLKNSTPAELIQRLKQKTSLQMDQAAAGEPQSFIAAGRTRKASPVQMVFARMALAQTGAF